MGTGKSTPETMTVIYLRKDSDGYWASTPATPTVRCLLIRTLMLTNGELFTKITGDG